VTQPPQEWFLNTPVLWLAALVLIGLLRRPLRNAPIFLKRLVRFAVASCLALGLTLLVNSKPAVQLSKDRPEFSVVWFLLMGLSTAGWIFSFFWIFLSRQHRRRMLPVAAGAPVQQVTSMPTEIIRNVPAERYSDVGGMDDAKEQIRQLIQAQLNPEKSKRYGVLRNGILLYGPRGTGKTFLARATAGEFGLNFEYVSAPKLLNRWIGATAENIQAVFAQAAARKPVLFFIDEIDSLGAGRQDAISDPGGAGREFNNITMALVSAIDQYRAMEGFVLLAVTNRLDGLDDALIREGRFDLKVRIDLPDETGRIKILEAQLSKKPWKRFDLREFARQMPGASAAKLRAVVDQAASFAVANDRKIEPDDLRQAVNTSGGKDHPQLERVEWDEVVIAESVKQDIKSLVHLLQNADRTRTLGLELPAGLLLIGPPGTGKTLVARLIASQTNRSFYSLTAASILGGNVGDSVKRVAAVFARAREHSPAIVFLDEMDGLLPANNRYLAQHDIQLVEQFLTEISALQSEHNIFLVGTTNHPENIDARVLRGGRFSEKVRIDLPVLDQRAQLLGVYLNGARLEAGIDVKDLAELMNGFAPADIQAICTTAKRMAFNRLNGGDQLPPLNWSDFEKAITRVRGETAQADGTSSR
jgi:transitional endoplasmic reticulum ATPase